MIFTFGYLGRSPDDLAAILAERGAMLVDIRFQPRSRVPAWNGGRLAARFGDAYLHLPQLGNRNYRTGGPVELADYPAGRAALAGLGRDAVLLCACRDYATCHRRTVAESLRADGFAVGGDL